MDILCATLHRLLRKYINGHFDQNVRRASEDLKLPYHRIRSIYNDTVKSIPFMDALRIFKATEQDGNQLLKEVYPTEFAAYQESNFSGSIDDYEQHLLYVFDSDTRSAIFNFVCATGRRIEELERKFGEFGKDAVNEMIKREVLKIDEEGYLKSTLGNHHATSAPLMHKYAERTFRLLDPNLRGTLFTVNNGSLNDIGWNRWYTASLRYHDEIKSITNDPDCQGPILVIGSVGMGPQASAFKNEGSHD